MSKPIKVVNTDTLRRINEESKSKGFNRVFPDQLWRVIDPRGTHVISVFMLHEHANGQLTEPHYRCNLFVKMRGSDEPHIGFFDMSIETFSDLLDA